MVLLRKLAVFISSLVVISGLGLVIVQKFQPQSRNYVPVAKPCSQPIGYSIGEVDPRFGVSKEKLESLAKESENIWEKNSGLDLFQYQLQSALKIKLVYDERQLQTDEAEQLQASLKDLDAQKLILEKRQGAASAEYNKKLDSFKEAVKKYEKRLAEYNKEVSLWNSQGGISQSEYDQLKKEEKNLKAEFNDLKEQESELNALAKKSNTMIAQENKIINNYNQAVTTYKSKFGTSREFEKGVFDPANGIVIYQFEEISDLEMTLMHEMGHAFGIDHVENPKSIMYYMIGEQNLNNPELTSEDISAVKAVCQLN